MRSHRLRAAAAASPALCSTGFIASNLVAHWDFGCASSWDGSSTTVTDLSGNSNHGTFMNLTSVDSSDFTYNSGNGGYVQWPQNYDEDIGIRRDGTDYFDTLGSNAFTIEFWIRPYWNGSNDPGTSGAPNYQLFSNFPQSSGYTDNFRVALPTFTANMRVRSPLLGASWTYLTPNNNYFNVSSGNLASQWSHLVYAKSAGSGTNNSYTTKIYINNSLIATDSSGYGTYTLSAPANYRMVGIGAAGESTGSYQGDMGIFRFYVNKELSASEVSTNYNVDKTRFGLS